MMEAGVMDPSFDDVDACHDGAEGNGYLAAFGEATDNLEPPHLGVPWVIFNGVRQNCTTIWIHELSNKTVFRFTTKT